MSISQFIEEKSRQLCFYLRAFWQGSLEYKELNLFFWDTLEEWSLYRSDDLEPGSHKERVFWHLLHQIHYWREDQLISDAVLKEELLNCVAYLRGESVYPMDCIGLRP